MQDPKTDHLVSLPPIFNTLQYIQIFLSACILGLSAYGISVIVELPAASLAIFTSLVTVIINTWFLVSSKKSPSLYNPIVVLILQCFLVIFWLATWADLLEWSVAFAYSNGCYVGRCVNKRTVIFSWDSYRDSVAAATGASITNFMLIICTLVIFSKRFHLHRKSGAPFASFGKWGNGQLNGSGAGGPRVPAPATQPQYQDQSEPNKAGAAQSVQAVPLQYGQQQPAVQVQHMQTPTGTPAPIYQQQGPPGSPQPMMGQQPQMGSRPVTMIQPMPQGQFVAQQQPQMFAGPGAPVLMGPPMGQQPQFQMMPPPQQPQPQFAPSPPPMVGGYPAPMQQGYWQPGGQPQFAPPQQQMYPPQNMAFAQAPQAMQVPVRQVSPVPTPPAQGGYRPPPLEQQGAAVAEQPPSPIQQPAVTELPVGAQQQQ